MDKKKYNTKINHVLCFFSTTVLALDWLYEMSLSSLQNWEQNFENALLFNNIKNDNTFTLSTRYTLITPIKGK